MLGLPYKTTLVRDTDLIASSWGCTLKCNATGLPGRNDTIRLRSVTLGCCILVVLAVLQARTPVLSGEPPAHRKLDAANQKLRIALHVAQHAQSTLSACAIFLVRQGLQADTHEQQLLLQELLMRQRQARHRPQCLGSPLLSAASSALPRPGSGMYCPRPPSLGRRPLSCCPRTARRPAPRSERPCCGLHSSRRGHASAEALQQHEGGLQPLLIQPCCS